MEKERREEEGMFGAMKPVDPYRSMRKKDATSMKQRKAIEQSDAKY